mgnify:FL=1
MLSLYYLILEYNYVIMRTYLTFLTLIIFGNQLVSQSPGDTTVIETLDFNDITKRRGWYIFPSDTNQYHKVLMYYTLKCDAATTQDNYACGEWDYTTYTRLYNHKNVNSPYYYYKNSNPEVISYNTTPKHNIFQDFTYNSSIDSIISENIFTIGTGVTSTSELFNTSLKTGKVQYVISALELQNQGLFTGDISRLSLDIQNQGEVLNNVTIKMKLSSLSALTDSTYETDNFTTVYNNSNAQSLQGVTIFDFLQPFYWNGTSNIIIDVSYNTNFSNNPYTISSDDLGSNMGLIQTYNGHLDFKDDEIVDIPSSVFDNIDSAITVSFWCFGDENLMPFNSYIFEGRDTNGYRVINCHLPWSNSRVYWDAGNNGTGSYDRVHELANINDYSGKWNHWAFTKDVSSGELTAYLNGELFMSASSKTRLMSGITKFRIGGNAAANFNGAYDGKIDEFRIWNTALDAATIKSWMNKTVTSNHPYYNHLQAAYDFNEDTGIIAHDYSGNARHGSLLGLPKWEAADLSLRQFDLLETTIRPKFSLYKGNYNTHLDSNIVNDTVYEAPISIVETLPYINMNVTGVSKNLIDTIYGYESGWGFTYSPSGIKVDSIDFGIDNQINNHYKQDIHQVQNYVTPYGIGLDLGPFGFRWVYDVTDYLPLFKDTLEISAGNQQELIDLKFLFIHGTPPRDVIDFKTIWRGDYGHANIANDISMPAVDVSLNSNATHHKIKTRTTGHWFGGFQNCAEFCPKFHHVKVNGTKHFEWLNWKECADNPVIAQGGTWIYDRAGWCPGTFGTTYDHEITPFISPGDTSVNIDYGMEVTSGGMEGNYRTTVQLVSYGDFNFQNDAAITDVLAPNEWEFHNRINPICDQPRILLKNTGEQDLVSVELDYWICGGPHETYTWNGLLEFDQETEIELPISSQSFWDHSQFCKDFHVQVMQANGVADESPENNHYQTTFEVPPVYPENIVLWVRTNGAGNETKLYVKDVDGNIVFSKTNYQSNTLHKDTLNLTTGCYEIEMDDTGQDGLDFFANSDGTGFFQIRKLTSAPLAGFESNFGKNIIHYFTVGYGLTIEDNNRCYFNCFPNPAQNHLNIESYGFTNQININIYDASGRKVFQDQWFTNYLNNDNTIDIANLGKGIYIVEVSDEFNTEIKRFIHQ